MHLTHPLTYFHSKNIKFVVISILITVVVVCYEIKTPFRLAIGLEPENVLFRNDRSTWQISVGCIILFDNSAKHIAIYTECWLKVLTTHIRVIITLDQ